MPAAVAMDMDQEDEDMPNFGAGGSTENGFMGALRDHLAAHVNETTENVGNGMSTVNLSEVFPQATEDELSFAASADKVQDVTEQIAEFLVNFSPCEQRSILAPFLDGGSTNHDEELRDVVSSSVEPHIDEARRFIWNFLRIYSQCERDLILENWRPATDDASISSATESLSRSLSITPPSITPPRSVTPGSVTPTAVTPREFLNARRLNSDTSPRYSPHTESGYGAFP